MSDETTTKRNRLSLETVAANLGINVDRLTTADRAALVPLYREAQTIYEAEARRAKHQKLADEARAERETAEKAQEFIDSIKARTS